MKRKQVMPEIFFERLEEVLAEKKIQCYQLSKDMGVSPNSVSEWINSYRVMSVVNYFELCKKIGVNPLYLYGMSDEK